VDTGKNPSHPTGVDVTRIGLGAPPRPPLVGKTPRPSGLSMDHGIDYGYCFFLRFVFSVSFALLTT
jgi:hypothetical protein